MHDVIFLVSGMVLLISGVLLAFKGLWGPLILLTLSSLAFYRVEEKFWGSVALSLLLAVILRLTSSLLLPIGIALLIAFIFLPVVRYLDRWKVPRSVSAFLVIFSVFSTTISVGAVVGYQIYLQLNGIIRTLQNLMVYSSNLEHLLRSYYVPEGIVNVLLQIKNQILLSIPAATSVLGTSVVSTVEVLFSTLIGLVIGFYVLKDTEVLMAEIDALIPENYKEILSDMYELLSKYFRGQLTVAFIVGSFVGISLQMLGIKYGFFIGFMAGAFNLIPNLGFTLTIAFGSLIILISEHELLWAFLKFAAVMTLDQLLETLVLTPRILGQSVGIHPVLVILSLIAGATLFGPLGVILAVPTAAFLRSLWIKRLKNKLQ